MKFFQKRSVAMVIMVLAVIAGTLIGQSKTPAESGVTGSFQPGSWTGQDPG